MNKTHTMPLHILQLYTEKFWSLINRTEDCWLWTPKPTGRGYGLFRITHDRQIYQIRSHRAAFMLHHNRTIPEGYFICHHCDCPICVNPKHLFLGLPKDNSADMVKKKRSAHRSGSRHSQAKLTEADVIIIKNRLSNGENSITIAKDFPVSSRMIRRIRIGENWNHV